MKTRAPALLTASLLALLAACSSDSSVEPTSTATIVLTDAPNEEIAMFEVDVEDIVLTRLNGSTVSVLPRKTRVDFADLETVSELIVGAGLPAGTYTGLSMTLDFSSATVSIVGNTTPATVLDPTGAMITGDVAVQMSFSSLARPQLAVNRNHVFVLDLDLSQSVAVDAGANEVTFTPAIDALVDPTNLKPIAMHGVLTNVNVTASELTLEKREPISGTPIGSYTVAVAPTTVFQIDGNVSQGPVGLAALALIAGGAPVVYVQGLLSTTAAELNAFAIETGAGTPGNGQDWVHGHIVARDNGAGSSATLTVLGFSVDESSGVRQFNTAHTVAVDPMTTKVLRRLIGAASTTDELNVGQRIVAFGALNGTALDATGSTGVVRMLLTSVWGVANGAAAGNTLTLNLSRIGLRQIGQFNFSVGGTPQSDPANYDVDVTGLAVSSVVTGSKIRAIGFVNPVDVASDDDFAAAAFVDHTTTASLLFCQWFPASTSAVTPTSMTPTTSEMTLDGVGTAALKVVGDGFGSVTLTTSPTPKIVELLPLGIYRIVENGAVELHFDYATFTQSLANRISPQSAVFRVGAFGTFNATTQQFQALVVSVILL